MSKIQSEKQLEDYLIESLVNLGYEYVNLPDEESILNNFNNQIFLHNRKELANKELSDLEFERLMISLSGKGVFQSAYNLRQKQVITRDDGSIVYIELINKNEWCQNRFQVTHQVTIRAHRENRYDVTLLINGLPLIQIELKRRGMDLKQAFNQINRYKIESFTGLFKYVQLFVISNGVVTKYVSNNEMKLNYEYAFSWADEKNIKVSNLNEFAKDFLNPCQIAKVISRYMVINQTDKRLMVMRPYQIHAVEKMVRLATETRNNGYVWHTTGSGKTLTSFKLSQILSELPDVEKVIFLVDRKDLDAQTLSEFNKFEPGSVDMTRNTYSLLKQLKDSTKTLLITTIQKMSIAVKNPRYESDMSPYKEKRVIFIVDECHRSQFGDMHKDIRKHFNNAQYFGFTGTPIFEDNANKGRATGDLFGKQVHTYMIKDGIRDHNVLGFKVDYIKTFSLASNIPDEDVEDINTKEVLEDDKRVNNIVDKILSIHSIKTHKQEYNAIFAVSSIHMAMKYYEAFKQKEHNLVIATIFTYSPNEELESGEKLPRDVLDSIIDDYNQHFNTNYSTDSYSGYFSDISKRVKNKQIDILIVVEMFLTGFDAQLLNTLYLDRRLRYHNLIQAFSRTNRIHTAKKQFGNIVSFLTKKSDVEQAIYLYSQSDSTDTVLMEPFEDYLKRASTYVRILRTITPTVDSVDKLESENSQKEFIEAFKSVVRIITTLNNFLEFDFTEEQMGLDKQEYFDYRSKYLEINRRVNKLDKVSVLSDICFDIELLSTDRINVDYILRLIANFDFENEIDVQLEIDKVIKIIEQNSDPTLHSKIDLLKRFLVRVVPTLKKDSEIEVEYEKFLNSEKEKEMQTFSDKIKVDVMILNEMISEYQYTSVMPNDVIRKNTNGKFIEKRLKMDKIRDFIVEITDTY